MVYSKLNIIMLDYFVLLRLFQCIDLHLNSACAILARTYQQNGEYGRWVMKQSRVELTRGDNFHNSMIMKPLLYFDRRH